MMGVNKNTHSYFFNCVSTKDENSTPHPVGDHSKAAVRPHSSMLSIKLKIGRIIIGRNASYSEMQRYQIKTNELTDGACPKPF